MSTMTREEVAVDIERNMRNELDVDIERRRHSNLIPDLPRSYRKDMEPSSLLLFGITFHLWTLCIATTVQSVLDASMAYQASDGRLVKSIECTSSPTIVNVDETTVAVAVTDADFPLQRSTRNTAATTTSSKTRMPSLSLSAPRAIDIRSVDNNTDSGDGYRAAAYYVNWVCRTRKP